MKINKTYTTPYHPQSDGKNENSHKFLMQIVRILTEKHPNKWCDMARVAAFAWNTSTLQALNYLSPYELMHGQQANLPHAMTKRREEICSEDMLPEDYTTYAKYLNEILEGYYAALIEAKLYTQMKKIYGSSQERVVTS